MTKTLKKRKTSNKKTRSNRKLNKISIQINFNARDKGYSDFLNPRLISFVMKNINKGNNLIQTQDDKHFVVYKKNYLHLQAIPVKKWAQYPSWNEIQCSKINEFIKASPCNIGINNKIFLKLKSNSYIGGFGTYIMALHLGFIDENQHKKFIETMQKIFKKNDVRVHNEDVDWFHLKQAKN